MKILIFSHFNFPRWVESGFIAVVFSAALIGLGYPPFHYFGFMIGWWPYWLFVSRDQQPAIKNVFCYNILLQLLLGLVALPWFYNLGLEYFKLSPLNSMALTALSFLFFHFQIPLSALFALFLFRRVSMSRPQKILLLTVLAILFERVFSSVFSWNLAYSLIWNSIVPHSILTIFGVEGFGSFLLLLQGLVAALVAKYFHKKKDFQICAIGAVIVLIVGAIVGSINSQSSYRLQAGESKSGGRLLQPEDLIFASVQLNDGGQQSSNGNELENLRYQKIDRYLKWIDQVVTQSQQQFQRSPDFIVLPESAIPGVFYEKSPALGSKLVNPTMDAVAEYFIKNLMRYKSVFIFGAFSAKNSEALQNRQMGNALVVYSRSTNASPAASLSTPALSSPPGANYSIQLYNKSVLLPFSERIPLDSIVSQFLTPNFLKKINFNNLNRGPGPQVLEVQTDRGQWIRVMPQICYEGTFPEFSFLQATTKGGADIFINITNDYWFNSTIEQAQHGVASWARGIEFAKPYFRVANRGWTGLLTVDGYHIANGPEPLPATGLFLLEASNLDRSKQGLYGHIRGFDMYFYWFLLVILVIYVLNSKGRFWNFFHKAP